MKCANCGCENPVYAVVCEQCGSFLPKEDMFVSKKESIPEVTEQTGLETISQGSSGVEQAGAEPISTEPADPKPISVEPTVVEPTFPAPTPAPEGKIRCRSCWEYNPKTAAVCEFCGKALHPVAARAIEDEAYDTLVKKKSEKIICVNCGKEVPWSTLTCSNCGKQPRVVQYDEDDDDESVISAFRGLLRDASKPQMPLNQVPDFSQSEAAQIRCRKCWQTSPPGSVTCQHCGARLPSEMKILPTSRPVCTCGYKNLPGVSVCLMCKGAVVKRCAGCGWENSYKAVVCEKCGQILE